MSGVLLKTFELVKNGELNSKYVYNQTAEGLSSLVSENMGTYAYIRRHHESLFVGGNVGVNDSLRTLCKKLYPESDDNSRLFEVEAPKGAGIYAKVILDYQFIYNTNCTESSRSSLFLELKGGELMGTNSIWKMLENPSRTGPHTYIGERKTYTSQLIGSDGVYDWEGINIGLVFSGGIEVTGNMFSSVVVEAKIFRWAVEFYSQNAAPSAPTNLTTAYGTAGAQVKSECSPSVDPDGDAVNYVWEQRKEMGIFEQMMVTSVPSATFKLPDSGSTFARRVKAVDAKGSESAYCTGVQSPLVFSPIISGQDGDLGTFAATPPIWVGTATQQGVLINITIKLDDSVLDTLSGTGNVNINLDCIARIWSTIQNGSHTIIISASNNSGGTFVRRLAFLKRETELEFFRGQSIIERPGRIQLLVSPPKSTWGDSQVTIFACNNGNDLEPVWVQVPIESVGDVNMQAINVVLPNMQKTDENWCMALHVKAVEGSSPVEFEILQVQTNTILEIEV